jgi:hypothetical protein
MMDKIFVQISANVVKHRLRSVTAKALALELRVPHSALTQDKSRMEAGVSHAQNSPEPKTTAQNVDQTIVQAMKSSTLMELADHVALE